MADNVAYGLVNRKVPRAKARERVTEVKPASLDRRMRDMMAAGIVHGTSRSTALTRAPRGRGGRATAGGHPRASALAAAAAAAALTTAGAAAAAAVAQPGDDSDSTR